MTADLFDFGSAIGLFLFGGFLIRATDGISAILSLFGLMGIVFYIHKWCFT
jgi:hypothetical protein